VIIAGLRRHQRVLALALAAIVGVVVVLGDEEVDEKIEPRAYIGPSLAALHLDRQTDEAAAGHWSRYDGEDAPEGGFMGFMNEGATELSATIPLKRALDPGTYYIAAKGISYGYPLEVKLAAGGGEVTVKPDDDDEHKYWAEPARLRIDSVANRLTVKLVKSGPSETPQKLLLTGLYLTSDAHENVLANDEVVRLKFPVERDRSPARPGNLVRNGSFETGPGMAGRPRTDASSAWRPSGIRRTALTVRPA